MAFIFLHLPNRGFDSFPAASAAQCTNDQGKFWQYHNLLYNIQGPIDSGWANRDNLKKFASQIPPELEYAEEELPNGRILFVHLTVYLMGLMR